MEKKLGFGVRIAESVVGLAFFVAGMALMLLGVTFLPVIGVVGAIPLMVISVSFFHTKSQKAQLDGQVQLRTRNGGPHRLATQD